MCSLQQLSSISKLLASRSHHRACSGFERSGITGFQLGSRVVLAPEKPAEREENLTVAAPAPGSADRQRAEECVEHNSAGNVIPVFRLAAHKESAATLIPYCTIDPASEECGKVPETVPVSARSKAVVASTKLRKPVGTQS